MVIYFTGWTLSRCLPKPLKLRLLRLGSVATLVSSQIPNHMQTRVSSMKETPSDAEFGMWNISWSGTSLSDLLPAASGFPFTRCRCHTIDKCAPSSTKLQIYPITNIITGPLQLTLINLLSIFCNNSISDRQKRICVHLMKRYF